MTRGAVRVRVSKDGAAAEPPAPPERGSGTAAQRAVPPAAAAAEPAADAANTVTAPLTGIFYRAPSPQTAPFVQVGGAVAVGEVIGLIEAMKLFNEIRSTKNGRVRRILAESGQLVRAHQPLIELDPA